MVAKYQRFRVAWRSLNPGGTSVRRTGRSRCRTGKSVRAGAPSLVAALRTSAHHRRLELALFACTALAMMATALLTSPNAATETPATLRTSRNNL